MGNKFDFHRGGPQEVKPPKQRGGDLAGTIRQAANVIEATKQAGQAVRGGTGSWWDRNVGILTALAGGAAIITPIIKTVYPLLEKKMDLDAAQAKERSDRAERALGKLQAQTKSGVPFRSNARLCAQDECVEVRFVADADGRLVAERADGTELVNCYGNRNGKRTCEWQGKEWSEE